MTGRHFSFRMIGVFCFSMAACHPLAAASAGVLFSPEEDSRSVAEIAQLIDTISRHHLSPPDQLKMMEQALAAIATELNPTNLESLRQQLSAAEAPDARRRQFLEALEGLTEQGQISDEQFAEVISSLAEIVPAGLRLVEPEEKRVAEQVAANRYVGIGIQLATDEALGRPVIPRVFENGPAFNAGARDHDVILTVDGQDTLNESLVDVVRWLRGPDGSTVTVEVIGPSASSSRTYTMTRGVVPFASIEKPVLDPEESVVGITVSRIAASTVQELRKLEAGLPATVDTVVLDARVTTADNMHYVELLGNSLIDNAVLGQIRNKSGTRECRAEPGRLFRGRQLVLLLQPQSPRPVWWLAAAITDTQTGWAMTERLVKIQQRIPPMYLTESRPIGAGEAFINVGQRGYVHLAVAELLRGDGRDFQKIDESLISLSQEEQRLSTQNPSTQHSDASSDETDQAAQSGEQDAPPPIAAMRVIHTPLTEILPLVRNTSLTMAGDRSSKR